MQPVQDVYHHLTLIPACQDKTLTCFTAGWTCVKPAPMKDHSRYACLCFVKTFKASDDVLSQVLTNLVELKALAPAFNLMMMSNPFQSASSLTSEQAEAQASDSKARLLHYYFSIPPPPGLQLPQQQAHQKWHCMVSRLHLKSKLIQAAHIVPKALAQARMLLALTSKPSNAHSHNCPCAVGRLRFGYN